MVAAINMNNRFTVWQKVHNNIKSTDLYKFDKMFLNIF